jgi:hypothetical protein
MKLYDEDGRREGLKKLRPNWKERIEEALITNDNCEMECGDVGCSECPFNGSGKHDGNFCVDTDLPVEVLMTIYRALLTPGVVKDFTDRDEIRARIAEMLDDDARAKFLGKPEPQYQTYHSDGGCYTYRAQLIDDNTPEFHWLISLGEPSDEIIAAFRDEETRDRVLAFLNGETK